MLLVLLRHGRLRASRIELVPHVRENVRLRRIFKHQLQVAQHKRILALSVLGIQDVEDLVPKESRVHARHVFDLERPGGQDQLSKSQCESGRRQRFLVHQRQSDELAAELEIRQTLRLCIPCSATWMERAPAIIRFEEAELLVHQLCSSEAKELSAVTISNSILAVTLELHLNATPQGVDMVETFKEAIQQVATVHRDHQSRQCGVALMSSSDLLRYPSPLVLQTQTASEGWLPLQHGHHQIHSLPAVWRAAECSDEPRCVVPAEQGARPGCLNQSLQQSTSRLM
mmetsp:Transcript_6974/g.12454  ORF Transcript_6974/g.12454 Transcript_6974/m.12454 type:complete len:285 (+) Transcript_6974:193-1047(+)